MHWKGRAEIIARHEDVHRTIFRNSTLKALDYALRLLAPGADRITLHLRRIERLQHPGEGIEVLKSRIKPQIVILRFENDRHRSCTLASSEFGVVVKMEQVSIAFPLASFQRSQIPAKANSESSRIPM